MWKKLLHATVLTIYAFSGGYIKCWNAKFLERKNIKVGYVATIKHYWKKWV